MAWNVHEPREGEFDFSGDRDVVRFVKTAADLGLYVILRPGPYICSEWDFGGFPSWLSTKQGIELRTNNPVFTSYFLRFFDQILPQLAQLDVAHGGNIILVQNENEHHMPCIPGRLEYFRRIALAFAEAGFRVPVVHCNRLFEGKIDDMIECINTWDHPIDDVARIRARQPDAPVLVTEFWCGGFDSWGRHHVTKDPRTVVRKAIEMLGVGAQVNYYMWHGGTNFGFCGGRVQYDSFYHITTSYDMDAPLAEGGELTEKYYDTKLVNMLANSMGSYFAESTAGSLQPAGYKDTMVAWLSGPRGDWAMVTSSGSEGAGKGEGVARTRLRLPSRRILDLTLEPFGAIIVPVGLRLDSGDVLDYTNLMPLGLFDGSVLVLHGQKGQSCELSINGQELTAVVPDTDEPQAISLGRTTVLFLHTDLARRCFWVDDRLVIGPDYVGSDVTDIRPLRGSLTYFESTASDPVVLKTVTAPAGKALPIIGTWKKVSTCAEPIDSSLSWQEIPGPLDLDALGVHYGYGWYRVRLHASAKRVYSVFMPECEDRATIFKDGEPVGTWGYGSGATREPLQIELEEGVNTLTILVDNLGRFCHSWRMGERKGLFGHIYEADEIDVGQPRFSPGGEFSADMIPHLPGHRNEDDHIPELLTMERWTADVEIDLNEVRPLYVCFQTKHNALVMCNGKVSRFFDIPGAGFGDLMLKDQLKKGINRLRFVLFGRVEADALKSLRVYRLKSCLTDEGCSWWFRRWQVPPQCEDEASAGGPEGLPAWYSTAFPATDYTGPLYLKLRGAVKGQLYLNGHNLGRYWVCAPQDTYYLPECWLGEVNELLVFDETGAVPAGAELIDDRAWVEAGDLKAEDEG